MASDPRAAVLIFLVSVAAGLLGSLLGLGGGIIIIPALTLLFGVDIRHAAGATAVSVIATSCGAAAAYLRDRLTNIRIGMFLEVATTTGALTGAYLGGVVSPRFLYIIFAVMMGYSALEIFKRRNVDVPSDVRPHPLAARLRLEGSYYDQALGRDVEYRAAGVLGGFGMMYLAGVVSGLLGLGSGVLKVAAMDMMMRLPMKVSSATSNFMIGVTAAATAGVYFSRGDIDPALAAPVALGVLAGALAGTRLMVRLRNTTIRKVFLPVLLYVSLEMLLKGIRG